MQNLTTGKPLKLIFLFTIPLLVGNIFQQFYNMVDMIIVGQTLGKNDLAAVGATGGMSFLVLGFAQGMTAGLSIVTAQRFGAKDYRGVKKSFAASIIISVVITVILTALSLAFLRNLLQLMQTPPEIINSAEDYISIIWGGFFAAMIYNLLSNMLRALGDSTTPLVILIIAVIINVFLDLLFILPFRMGVAGAAYATVLAQLIASLYCIFYIKRKVPFLQLQLSDFKFEKDEFKQHLHIGLPMGFQSSIISIGSVILQSALNTLGTNAVAAQATCSRIDQFATQPMMSFGIAMATFTAQNYGAKKYSRILKGVKQCLMMSISFSLLAGAIVIFFGHFLVQLFVNQSETKVFELAQTYFNINGSMYWILAILFIVRYTLQGLGQSVVPTIAGIMELIMRSFAAIILTVMFGYPGAAAASPLAWVGSVAVLLFSYFKAVKKMHRLEVQQELKQMQQDLACEHK